MQILDVGCGPGTITVDLAQIVAPGSVVGIDREPSVVAAARGDAERREANVDFRTGDVYALDFAADTFDVVHAHQVLQHLRHPVSALSEMRRVLRPDGLLAVRDSDYAGFVWSPADSLLDRWLEVYHQVSAHNGAEADAGRHLPQWVRAAGFTDIEVTTSTWTFADKDSRAWWGGLWADRVLESSFAVQAVDYGLTTTEELLHVATAWRRWAEAEDGFFAVLHAEVLARPGPDVGSVVA